MEIKKRPKRKSIILIPSTQEPQDAVFIYYLFFSSLICPQFELNINPTK